MGTRRCVSKKRRCDKIIDCLAGDDELDCPESNFPALFKHALDNMILFAPNNETSVENTSLQDMLTTMTDSSLGMEKRENNDDAELRIDVNEEQESETSKGNEEVSTNVDRPDVKGNDEILKERSDVEREEGRLDNNNNEMITIAKQLTTSTTEGNGAGDGRSGFTGDDGQASAMNRNGDISSTFTTPVGVISDTTTAITNPLVRATTASAGAVNETANASITESTFITSDDTISKSTAAGSEPTTSTHVVTPATLTTSIQRATETPAFTVINDSRGALNSTDKSMTEAAHKTEQGTSVRHDDSHASDGVSNDIMFSTTLSSLITEPGIMDGNINNTIQTTTTTTTTVTPHVIPTKFLCKK